MDDDLKASIVIAAGYGVGAAQVLVPSVVNKLFGLPKPGGAEEQFSRMMGLRNVALAQLASEAQGAERRRLFQLATAMFAADTVVTVAGAVRGKAPARSAVLTGITTATLAALSYAVATS